MSQKVTDFEVVDHGIDGSQYFPGCGVSFTSFSHVDTGNGDTFSEAIEDALESIAQETELGDLNARIKAEGFDGPVSGWQSSRSAMAECRKANGQMTDAEWDKFVEDNDTDVYYYVSIRYNVQD